MRTKNAAFTFLDDFAVIPMDSGSYMIEQGLKFSRAFSNLSEVVDFLIVEKEKFLASIATTSKGYPPEHPDYEGTKLTVDKDLNVVAHQPGYEPYDRTGTPGYADEDPDE